MYGGISCLGTPVVRTDAAGTSPFWSIELLTCSVFKAVRHIARADQSVDMSYNSNFTPKMSNAESEIMKLSGLPGRRGFKSLESLK